MMKTANHINIIAGS